MSTKKEKPVCLRCSGPIEDGMMTDASIDSWQIHGALRHFWIQGPQIPAGSRGLLPLIHKIRGRTEKRYLVNAYRCSVCGYLELYAKTEA